MSGRTSLETPTCLRPMNCFVRPVPVGDADPVDLLRSLVGAREFDLLLDVPVRPEAALFAEAGAGAPRPRPFPACSPCLRGSGAATRSSSGCLRSRSHPESGTSCRCPWGTGAGCGRAAGSASGRSRSSISRVCFAPFSFALTKPPRPGLDVALAAGDVAVDPQLVRLDLWGHRVASRAEALGLGPLLRDEPADSYQGAEPAHDGQRDDEAAAAARRSHEPTGEFADPVEATVGASRLGLARHDVALLSRLVGQRQLQSPRGFRRSSTGRGTRS